MAWFNVACHSVPSHYIVKHLIVQPIFLIRYE
jgi:hypothetical protein